MLRQSAAALPRSAGACSGEVEGGGHALRWRLASARDRVAIDGVGACFDGGACARPCVRRRAAPTRGHIDLQVWSMS